MESAELPIPIIAQQPINVRSGMHRRTYLKLAWAMALGRLPAVAQPKPDSIEIGSRLELFADRYLIERMNGTELRLQTPIQCEHVLTLDRPWEGAFCGYFTVIRDGAEFHLYYRGVGSAGSDGCGAEVTCYAHSTDGIHWTRPSLGLFEVHGTKDNNVILAHEPPFSHNFCPFLDTRPGIPATQRFRALAGVKQSGLMGFGSADGVHWKKLRKDPVLPPANASAYDSQNLAFWSEAEQRYLCYYRTFKQIDGMGGVRWISKSASEDFLIWEPGREMSFGDAPPEHLYTNQTSAYFRAPHIYVSIAARFMPGRRVITNGEAAAIGVHPDYYKDCADAVLLTSRGGYQYDRTFLEGFLRPGVGLENWVSRDNYPALNILQTGPAEMSFYVNRHYGQASAHLSRYKLRLDGLASLHAPYRGAEMTTKVLRFAGHRLELNYSTSAAGSIRVEVQQADGSPVRGFALADCREIIGDRIERDVEWIAGHDLASLAGKPVRLRFQLKDADLFAIRFHD